jgi:hypothetical protein
MKQALFFLIKFIALTAPLTWLWQKGGRAAYREIHVHGARLVFELLEVGHVPTPGRQRFISIIPFIALVLMTPRLSIRRRWLGLLLGLLALFLLHIFSQLWADPETRRFFIWTKLLLDAAPFVLWVVIAHEYVENALARTIGSSLNSGATQSKDR